MGCKLNNVDIVYTMWSNLKKTGDMAVGQVGFKNNKAVKKMRIEKKCNEIINRLNKTKVVDDQIDYRAEREARDDRERKKDKERAKTQREKEKAEREKLEKERQEKSYDSVFSHAQMTTNQDGYDSDDFM
uniref:Coiled-coil domain-containing protein 25 n=1 Tax=Panagrolaimus sp. JU765 TaxID=591449 RepID=A0AC34R4G2_9BILA